MLGTKLTHHWNVRNQIDIIERLETKLKYNVKDRNQICNLPNMHWFLFLKKVGYRQRRGRTI